MTWICEEHYLVESQTTPDKVYRVNMRLGFCKCVAGLNIAHGREEKSSWYRPLTQPNEVSNFTDNIEEYGTQAQSGSK